MLWLIWCIAIANINGCFYGGPTVRETASYGGPTVRETASSCVQIPAPAPLAKDIKMSIYEGDLLSCNAGCEKLLREYTGTREAILEAWPPK